jgi:putative oxidoreductase
MDTFPDPLHVGSVLSLTLAVFAEFFCSVLVIFGLMTRLAAVPVVIMMTVAISLIHAADPIEKKELAFLYLVPFLALIFTGAGRYSLDGIVRHKK